MKTKLQKSTPSEVDKAVPLIYSSGPDAFEYVFKNSQVDAQDFLKYAFVTSGGEFSYQNHCSLYLEEEMIGIGSFYNKKVASKFTISDASKIISFYKFRCPAVLKNGLQVERIIKLPVKHEITIGHLGILPEYRSKGLGTTLILGLMDLADKTAESNFVLDVSEENPKAKALYDRLGFVVTKKYNSKLKNKYSYVPNHFRMKLSGPTNGWDQRS